jgi:outer membrane protein
VAVFAQAKEPAVVQKINVEGSAQVVIFPSHEVTYRLSSLPPDMAKRLPARFYVDLAPARLDREVPRRLAAGDLGVERVRIGQFSATTVRVVLDVREVEDCRVFSLADPYRVVVEVKGKAQTPRPPPTSVEGPAVAGLPFQEGVNGQIEEKTGVLPLVEFAEEKKAEGTPQLYTINREEEEATAAEEAAAPEKATALEEAYSLALRSEEQIKIAERELAKARLLPWRAMAIMTPRAGITGVYRQEKDEIAFQPPEGFESVFGGSSAIRPKESWQGIFTAIQPLLAPSFIPSWRLGKDSVRQSEDQYMFTIREVLFGVAQAYYNVLRGQKLVEVSVDTLRLTQDELEVARTRFRVGEVTKTDVLRAEVEVERARRALVENENELQLNIKVLARAIGAAEPLQVIEPMPLPPAKGAYEELLDQAYKQREDLRALNSAVRVAQQGKNLVLARYSPSVQTQWQFPRLSDPTFAQPDEFWTLLLNFEVPLFDGGTRELDLLEAAENLAQAKLQYDQLRKDISVEVRRAFLGVQTLETTLETLRKEVALAQENYDITSKQYRVGLATSLDVNTALNNLNQVRTQFTNQSYAYQVTLLNLQRVVGTFADDYVPRR